MERLRRSRRLVDRWPDQPQDEWQGEWPEVSKTQQFAAMLQCSLEEAGQSFALKSKGNGRKGKGKGKGKSKGGGKGDYGKGAPAQLQGTGQDIGSVSTVTSMVISETLAPSLMKGPRRRATSRSKNHHKLGLRRQQVVLQAAREA